MKRQLLMRKASDRPEAVADSLLEDKPRAAKLLGISDRSIDNYMKSGELPYVKLGRRVLFRRRDLEAFVDSRVQRRQVP